MGLSQIVLLLAEKETQIKEIQRLLAEAQSLLNRVLEIDSELEGSQSSRIQPQSANLQPRTNREIAG